MQQYHPKLPTRAAQTFAYNGEVMTKRLQGRYLSYFILITTIFLSIFVSSVLLLVANIKIIKAENDNLVPKEHHVSVSITNPPANVQTVLEKSIIINGTALLLIPVGQE